MNRPQYTIRILQNSYRTLVDRKFYSDASLWFNPQQVERPTQPEPELASKWKSSTQTSDPYPPFYIDRRSHRSSRHPSKTDSKTTRHQKPPEAHSSTPPTDGPADNAEDWQIVPPALSPSAQRNHYRNLVWQHKNAHSCTIEQANNGLFRDHRVQPLPLHAKAMTSVDWTASQNVQAENRPSRRELAKKNTRKSDRHSGDVSKKNYPGHPGSSKPGRDNLLKVFMKADFAATVTPPPSDTLNTAHGPRLRLLLAKTKTKTPTPIPSPIIVISPPLKSPTAQTQSQRPSANRLSPTPAAPRAGPLPTILNRDLGGQTRTYIPCVVEHHSIPQPATAINRPAR
ncbi:hypothetical protein BJ170DRAFT_678858 [Xylariales sp. AK1849]|nr:hypothetical protein BJ170DRAFT_678858 [Xylariales sp. AK1849]